MSEALFNFGSRGDAETRSFKNASFAEYSLCASAPPRESFNAPFCAGSVV
jgi:hypothetical protein